MHRVRSWGDGAGWIYAAQEDGDPLVKIGYTCTTLCYRLGLLRRQYRPSDLTMVAAVRVEAYTRSLEQSIHRALQPQRIKGEWFYLYMNQDILETLVQEAMTKVLGITIDMLAGKGEEEETPAAVA